MDNPFATKPAFASVAALAPTPVFPPGTAIDRDTGEVIMDDKGKPMTRDALLLAWRDAQKLMESAKRIERDLRDKVVAVMCDPNKETGTERADLGGGWQVKVVKALDYKLISPQAGLAVNEAVAQVLNALCSATTDANGEPLDPVVGLAAARTVVKWKPEISVKELKLLTPGHRAIIDSVLEIKAAAPTVEIEPPKDTP